MNYAEHDWAVAEISEPGTDILIPSGADTRRCPDRSRLAVVAVVEDGVWISRELAEICEFLDISVERVPSHGDLDAVLVGRTPMAVVCELDGAGQDGCHVMKTVASHDPSLPIMLLTGDDPALAGAADAVEEIWQLTEVTKLRSFPSMAGLVDFLFLAGRKGRCMRLMPA
jgi:hypothetical protein